MGPQLDRPRRRGDPVGRGALSGALVLGENGLRRAEASDGARRAQNPARPAAAALEGCAVKALSLWQRWASAMALGWKRIETRHWSLSYRGLLAIHAAKRWSR